MLTANGELLIASSIADDRELPLCGPRAAE
jgi:hypothetical protein